VREWNFVEPNQVYLSSLMGTYTMIYKNRHLLLMISSWKTADIHFYTSYLIIGASGREKIGRNNSPASLTALKHSPYKSKVVSDSPGDQTVAKFHPDANSAIQNQNLLTYTSLIIYSWEHNTTYAVSYLKESFCSYNQWKFRRTLVYETSPDRWWHSLYFQIANFSTSDSD